MKYLDTCVGFGLLWLSAFAGPVTSPTPEKLPDPAVLSPAPSLRRSAPQTRTDVPEPATYVIVGSALIVLSAAAGAVRRRHVSRRLDANSVSREP
jgi:hypothetical protein